MAKAKSQAAASPRKSPRKTAASSKDKTSTEPPSPSKVAKKSPMAKRSAKTDASKADHSESLASRKRGLANQEDDSEFDSSLTLDQILASIDKRTLTRSDKQLQTWIEDLESGKSTHESDGDMFFNEEARLLEEGKALACNFHLYWLFRKQWEVVNGPVTIAALAEDHASPEPVEKTQDNRATDPSGSGVSGFLRGGPSVRNKRSVASQPARPVRGSPSRSRVQTTPAASSHSVASRKTASGRITRARLPPSHQMREDPLNWSPLEQDPKDRILRAIESTAYNHQKLYGRQKQRWQVPTMREKYGISLREFDEAQLRGMQHATDDGFLARDTGDSVSGEESSVDDGFWPFLESISSASRGPAPPRQAPSVGARLPVDQLGPMQTRPRIAITPPPEDFTPRRVLAGPSPAATTAASAKELQLRKDLGTNVAFGPEVEKRGSVHPAVSRAWLEITRDRGTTAERTEERPNAFFETLPGPEIWHRRMPPYFMFGETKYMQQVVSDQINRDLHRVHPEQTPAPLSTAPTGGEEPGILAQTVNRLSFGILGKGSSAAAADAAAAPSVDVAGEPEQVVPAPRDDPWALPDFDAAVLSEKRGVPAASRSPGKRTRRG